MTKIPFKIETVFNKIFKPQIVTIVETFINNKPSQKFYGKSLTGNFLMMLYNHFANNSVAFALPSAFWGTNISSAGVNILGNNVVSASPNMNIDGLAGVLLKGIILGSGNTAPVPGNVALQTPIVQGAGAGQLQYALQTSTQGTTIIGQNTSFILERLFVNASAGDVNVNEIGIVRSSGLTAATTYLIYRDVLGATDVIPTLNNYRVNITFQITT